MLVEKYQKQKANIFYTIENGKTTRKIIACKIGDLLKNI